MSEILSQMFTLPVKIILVVTVVILVALWLLSILWVNRDAKAREIPALPWTIIAIIPAAGVLAYCLLRPPLTAMDEDEQAMELDLLQRQLSKYGNCPHCGYPVESDYIACPHCRKRLRPVCSRCDQVLEPDWTCCPYCAAPVERKRKRSSQRKAHGADKEQPKAAERENAEQGKQRGGAPKQPAPKKPSGKDPFEPSSK